MPRDRPVLRMEVTKEGLRPVDGLDGAFLARHPVGSVVQVTIQRKISPALLKLLWSIVSDIQPSTDWPTPQALMQFLKTQARHIESFVTSRDGVTVIPASLTDLDHDEAVDFLSTALQVIQESVAPGIDLDGIMREKIHKMRRGA